MRAAGLLHVVADTPPNDLPPRSRLFPSSWAGRAGLFCIVWGLAMTTFSVLNASWRQPPTNRPLQAPVANDYVTSDTCRSCHPGNYASWHASYHRTMTQVAHPENFAADMDGLELSYDNIDYRVKREAKAYFVSTKPKGAPESAYGKPLEIVLLTGSHNLQIYWTETDDKREGRTMGQFPFGYIIAEKKWAPVQHTFLIPPGPELVYSKGDWNDGCINCHTTQGRARPGGNGVFDSKVSEFGISCEACHSGGREHVEINRNPLRRWMLHLTGGQDKTIANPGRMNGQAASLACGQCHSIWAFKNPADTKIWDTQGSKFRPGNTDLDMRWVVQPKGTDHPAEREALMASDPHFYDKSFWGDGKIRVTGREFNGVLGSPCYKGGEFSCLSCHEMHPDKTDAASLKLWARTDQMKPKMESDQACLQCHQEMKTTIPAHTHHAAGSPGSSCYNCHMPHTTYGLLRAIRSHTVSSPNIEESTVHGRPNACNLCHLDKPLAWTAEYLEAWYGQKSPALSRDDRELSAAVQWILKGDAGQRAIIAWNMGWAPAQKAAGQDWLYPFLIFTLNDPYAAVRFAAYKSLQTLPKFEDHPFDYTVDDAGQKKALGEAYQKWWFQVRDRRGVYRPETVLEPSGQFRQAIFDRLLDNRDQRKILLAE